MTADAFRRRLFAYPPLAHHPTCRCYDGHLLRFGPVALCLGCTLLGVGVVLGLIAFPLLAPLGGLRLFLLALALFLPTLVQPFVQVKAVKAASRLLLGASVPLMWFAAWLLPPWDAAGVVVRLGFVALFAAVYRFSTWLRKRYTPRPCDTCPHGRYPLCEGNRSRVERLLSELRRDDPDMAQRVAALVAAGDVDGLRAGR